MVAEFTFLCLCTLLLKIQKYWGACVRALTSPKHKSMVGKLRQSQIQHLYIVWSHILLSQSHNWKHFPTKLIQGSCQDKIWLWNPETYLCPVVKRFLILGSPVILVKVLAKGHWSLFSTRKWIMFLIENRKKKSQNIVKIVKIHCSTYHLFVGA